MWYILYARHYFKYFSTIQDRLISSSFDRWENWETQELRELLKVIQLTSYRVRIKTQRVWFKNLCTKPLISLELSRCIFEEQWWVSPSQVYVLLPFFLHPYLTGSLFRPSGYTNVPTALNKSGLPIMCGELRRVYKWSSIYHMSK